MCIERGSTPPGGPLRGSRCRHAALRPLATIDVERPPLFAVHTCCGPDPPRTPSKTTGYTASLRHTRATRLTAGWRAAPPMTPASTMPGAPPPVSEEHSIRGHPFPWCLGVCVAGSFRSGSALVGFGWELKLECACGFSPVRDFSRAHLEACLEIVIAKLRFRKRW